MVWFPRSSTFTPSAILVHKLPSTSVPATVVRAGFTATLTVPTRTVPKCFFDGGFREFKGRRHTRILSCDCAKAESTVVR